MKTTFTAGRFFALAVTLSFWFAAMPAAMAQGRPALIGAAQPEMVNINPGPGVRSRLVTLDFSALNQIAGSLQSRPGQAPALDIAFFDDRAVTMNVEQLERLPSGVTNYYGPVEGDPYGRAVITDSNGVMAATVFTNGKTYNIRLRSEGYVSREVNTARLSEHADDMTRPLTSGARADAIPPVAMDTAAFIDVIVLYTTKTRIAAGSVAAVEAEVNNGIAVTNSAYANTGVTHRVRLAYTGEINYTGDTATVNLGTVIQALQPNNGAAPTGVFAGIPALRNTYGGDILSLWIEGDGPNGGAGNSGCGIGYFMDPASASFAPFAVNVLVRENCAVDNQSFPHEMGHNMGLDHDIFVSVGSASKPYARGYVDVPNLFRTIMAYNNACLPSYCTRINGFSSPLFTYTGLPVGTLVADSSRAMNENALTVANFKTSVIGPGTLQVRAATLTVSEAVGTAQIAVARVGGSSGAVSVDYTTANGSAIAGTDYTSATGTLNWADGDGADKMLPVPILQNASFDNPRTFTATVSNPGGGAALGAILTTTVTINEDDQFFAFGAPTTIITEGAAASVTVAVNRVGIPAGAVSVTWHTEDGAALAGTDFGTAGSTTQRTGVLNWANGDGTAKNITVGLAAANIPIINDTIIEANKNFTIWLTNPTGGPFLGPIDVNTVTIVSNDSSFSFASGTANVNETGPNITLTINRTGSTAVAQAVTYTTTNGTAVAPGDYLTTTGMITFGVGETSKTIAVGPAVVAAPYIRIYDDAVIEGPETFNVTLSAPTAGATLGATTVTVVTIASNENGVSMQAASLAGVNESSGAINVVANRSGSTGAVDVNYAFTNGTALNGTHYVGTPGTLHWNDGESGPKNIPVTINDDATPNTARAFTVTLSGAAGATLVAPMSTAISIADNDNTVQFTAPTAMVTEGTANIMLTVSRTGVSAGQAAQVSWAAADGSGFAGTDYGILGNITPPSGTLNWAAGDAASKTITIPILNDALIDGAKTFTVSLSAPVGPNLAIGANPVSTVTVNDNEKAIAFLQPTYVVTEGLAPNTVTLTVVRTGAVNMAATATWATVNGTAESGKDFGILNNLAPRTGTVSWAINDATNKTIVIPILNDTIGGEGAETFTVTLVPGAGYVLGPNATATVTINDDDIPPQTAVQFAQPKYVVLESVGNAVLTLTRTDLGPGCALQSSVNYATVAGTALATSDYTTKTGTVTWAPGDGCVDKQVTIAIVNNTVAESPESFKVVLSGNNPGTGFGANQETSVLILDDDEAFPLDGAMPNGFSTSVATTKGWHVSNDPGAYEGVFALKSDEIDDGETAGLEMTGTFAAGSVSFRVKISTEPTFDTLTFYVDGVLQTTWSGVTNTAWQMSPSYPIGAGVHTLRWVYTKDGSVSAGVDAVYLDGLVTPTFTP